MKVKQIYNKKRSVVHFSRLVFQVIISSMNNEKSLQETYAPDGICFGCGVKNEKGLRIKSYEDGAETVAEWRAEPHHQAFPVMLNGGIVGALLDCHSNWTAANF